MNFHPKNKTMRTILIAAICLLLFAFCLAQQPAPAKEKDKLLAGKTFKVEYIETGAKKKEKPLSDELSFKANKMTSKLMYSAKKFPASPYTVSVDSTRENGAVEFICESINPDSEALTWEAITMPNGTLEGTVKKFKKGRMIKEYIFTGTLKTKTKK